jgi:hypothetical protein
MENNEENKPKLPTITVVTSSKSPGSISRASAILMDGKPISGLTNFHFEIDGDDQTGLPTVKLSLKAYVQVVIEKSEDEPTKQD